MPKPTLHRIGNDRSAPQQIVQWCLQQWPKALPDGLVFCVPSALAMRRLRDALVKTYTTFQGVRFTQPTGLTTYFAPTHAITIATETEQLCVWDRVFDWLAQMDGDNIIAQWLFPGKNEWLARPAARYTVAQRFIKLRATLVEALLDFGSVARHPQTQLLDAREQGRWAALDALETHYRELLAELQLTDPTDLQLEAFRHPTAISLEGKSDWHLVVACVPDMMPALQILMEAAPQCDILVQASPNEANRFTAYGTPDPTYWMHAQLSLPDASITLAETPTDEAAYIEHFLARTGKINPQQICLGVLNREIMPFLTSAFAIRGLQVFEPAPIPLSRQSTTRILRDLFKLASSERIELVLPLLSIPEMVTLVASDYTTLRRAFVDLIDIHRPTTLRDAARFLKADSVEKALLNRLEQWIQALRQNPCEGTKRIFSELFGQQFLDPVKDATRFATFEALQRLLDEILQVRVPNITPTEDLLMTRLMQTSLHPIRGTSETSYEGRFEILWSEAKDFAIAGLNEGIFPDTTFEDAFLPNAFRKALGLRSDINRIARDAYILETLCERCAPENLSFSASRLNTNGDWMKPSRLFFRCDSETQKKRAKQFFLHPAVQVLATGDLSSLSFATTPTDWLAAHEHAPTRLSPSAIATFLNSPYNYWIEYVLRLKDTKPLEAGIQPNVFGTLIHSAMETLRWTDACTLDQLENTLITAFDQCFYERYGGNPSIELITLQHAAHKRLKQAAITEMQLRTAGWKTLYSEKDTRKGAWEVPLCIDGKWITLYGQIDRVDYNEKKNIWRVIDYKTGTSASEPNNVHYKKIKHEPVMWMNFQLPIYRLLTRHALQLPPDATIEMAYFSLPGKAQSSIALMEDPVDEAATLDDLKAVLQEMLTLSEETLLKNIQEQRNPLLKHLLLSCLKSNDTDD